MLSLGSSLAPHTTFSAQGLSRHMEILMTQIDNITSRKSETQGKIKKNLHVASPKGTANGCMVRASHTAAGATKSHQVTLSGDELIVMKELLHAAVPQMLKWD